jgi:uncharacterized protein (TIRG00374 family)
LKRALQFLVLAVVSGACIWYTMKDVPLREVWNALRSANYLGFTLVMAVTLLGFWLRALRWPYFLRTERRIPVDSLFSATMIGFMVNQVLPFRLGELARPWALARKENLSRTTLLATIVVERAVDMLTLLAIFGLSLMVHPIAENTPAGVFVQLGARVMIAASVLLTIAVVLAERNRAAAHRVLERAFGFLPGGMPGRLVGAADHFLDGFGLFRDVPRLVSCFAFSMVMFLCYALGLSIAMRSMHLDVPWHAGLVMLVVTAIGIMAPSLPGGAGPLNVACSLGLALFGITDARASAFGWFYFFSQWLPITAVGLFYLNREGLSLRTLRQAPAESA